MGNSEDDMSEQEHKGVVPSKAHLRHLKRYVQAPVHRFAAIVPPELVSLCHDELAAMGFSPLAATDAGVEFFGKLRSCHLPNLALRTASRILCRLPPFRAGVAQELFHKVLLGRWELWLNPELPIEARAFVRNSRIDHEGLVAETVLQGVRKRFQMQRMLPPTRWPPESLKVEGAESGPKQRMLIHLRENHCEISLDTTGDHLHRRGYRLEHAGAPLRETLAAAILLRMKWNGATPLVDGMCGAGTVPIEAALLARRLAPGLRRSFLIERWPGFQEQSWNHLREELLRQALVRSPVSILGIEEQVDALAAARKNAERAGVEQDIQWQCGDFFAFKPQDHQLPPGLLVLDPPYGKRLEGGGKPLYERIGLHLRRYFEGWQAAILVPGKTLAVSLRMPAVRFWRIVHGGSPVLVAMARL